MSKHGRRHVLKCATLAVAAGGVLPAGVVAANDGDGDDESGNSAAVARGWSSLRGNAGNTGSVPDETGPDAPVTVAWEYGHEGPVAVADGVVYLTVDGAIHALDAEDGSLVGKSGDLGAAGGPSVAGTTVYVGGKQLTAFDTDSGEVRWQTDLEYDEAIPSPVVAGGRVFVVAGGTLYALNAENGAEAWHASPNGGALMEQTVAVADNAVFTSDGETLYAHESDSGTNRWSTDTGMLRRQVIVATEEVVSLQAGSIDEVAVYDTKTGDVRWTGRGYVSGLATDESIYTLVRGDIIGYDQETGNETWRPKMDSATYSAPVTDGETVYVGLEASSAGTSIVAFNSEDGASEWKVETKTHPRHLAITDETIYASTDGLLAIRSKQEGGQAGENGRVEERTESKSMGKGGNSTKADNGSVGASNGSSKNGTNGSNASDGTFETTNKSGSSEGSSNAADDRVPGFTAGTGIAGGAFTLEWLRRQAESPADEE